MVDQGWGESCSHFCTTHLNTPPQNSFRLKIMRERVFALKSIRKKVKGQRTVSARNNKKNFFLPLRE